jgi:hypothetical protein
MSRNQCLLKYGRVNVWVGILGDQLLGPPVLPNRVTGAVYHRFLANSLSVLLEHVPLHQQHMRSMHDGAPPHFLRIVRHRLIQTFGKQWIGCGGSVNWPERSPDLNPLVAVGDLQILVYSAPISDLEALEQRVENVYQEIRVKPGIFDRVHTSVRRRAESCVEMHGNHTGHLLWRSHEHRPYLSRHWFLDICWLGLLAHLSEYSITLNPVSLFLNTLYNKLWDFPLSSRWMLRQFILKIKLYPNS